MINVAGYSNLQIIHQSPETLVYTAKRNRDGAKVVLRQLRPEVASPERVARFRKEFELLAAIDSPHVITAQELIEQRSTTILVTEDIGGESLSQYQRRQPISVREAVHLATAVTTGLDELHARNIIH
ncbi:MAG TPA: protein kinase, partial [Pseudomonadales bacterium]|nr:protein kinase [Pseudomonadales bacterium]